MSQRTLTRAQVKQHGQNLKLCPGEKELVAAGFKVRRRYRKDGSYTYKAKFKTNDGHGRLTKQAEAAIRMFKPFGEADNARAADWQSRVPRVEMSDANGRPQFVDVEKADAAAKANGWRHRIKVGRQAKRFMIIDGKSVQIGGPRGH